MKPCDQTPQKRHPKRGMPVLEPEGDYVEEGAVAQPIIQLLEDKSKRYDRWLSCLPKKEQARRQLRKSRR